MGIKKLFRIPEGEKVTEKAFARVLISSIFSILLCMTCLISTTWAWFTVSVENQGNEIKIAKIDANVSIEGATESENGSYNLAAGTYQICVKLEQAEQTPDDANLLSDSQRPMYVVMTLTQGETVRCISFPFADKNEVKQHQLIVGNGSVAVSFSVSWIMPARAQPVGSEAVVIGEIPSEPATTTAATEETTVPVTTE